MKLFPTDSIETVRSCQENFCSELPSVLLEKRTAKLEIKFHVRRLFITCNKKSVL